MTAVMLICILLQLFPSFLQRYFRVARQSAEAVASWAATAETPYRPKSAGVVGMGIGLSLVIGQGLLVFAMLTLSVLVMSVCVVIVGVLKFFARNAVQIARSQIDWVAAAISVVFVSWAARCAAALFDPIKALKLAMMHKAAALPPARVAHRSIAHLCILRRIVPTPIARA